MNARVIIIAVIAIIGVVAAYFLSQSWLTGVQQGAQQQASAPKLETVDVMIAARPLSTGTIIKIEDMKYAIWPKAGLSEFYIPRGATTPQDLVGKVVRYSIGAGEPMVLTKLVSQGDQGFLAAILNPDMRAVSISISNTSGVAGFILPGDRVDIILTHSVADALGVPHTVSETILQNVRVLAIDQRSSDAGTTPILGKTATLEVTPKIAEKFTMLSNLGRISLALRGLSREDGDTTGNQTSTPMELTISRTWDSEISPLFGKIDEDEKKKSSITINRGGTETVIQIDKDKKEGDEQ